MLCIGLDSDRELLPQSLSGTNKQFEFNKAIIDATVQTVCAYKLNSAFYEAQGAFGIEQLKMTCEYLQKSFPFIPIILDAKRGDIGSTNKGYASFAFDYLEVDAITLNPYLGRQANQLFLDYKDKGLIFLARTSNPGAEEFQHLIVEGEPLYMKIAKAVMTLWNDNNNCLLVVGATAQEELQQIREQLKEATFLVPGIGKQGGDLKETLINGKNSKGTGLIISSSRSIIFASTDKDFAQKAAYEAEKLRSEMNT